MENDASWGSRVGETASSVAKGAWFGAEAAAIIASSPAGIVQDAGISLADPLGQSALVALSDSHEALESAVEASAKADDIQEEIDVSRSDDVSLMVDPPSWLSDPTDLELSIAEDLGIFASNETDLSDSSHEDSGDLGRE
ncbi:hypothetical protein J2S98_002561 [Arthrobacter oryzae]|uniref:hypothetical protein n=1 Tax=Arthrobacter oryzae TaxID=409290 RepID=UPI002787E5EA|nr:hypothetical protein [Arthrobacter oryzae]MDP9987394.1 hypothetical protein [Arthrobacter oryzae]